jgi:hypothetical protein
MVTHGTAAAPSLSPATLCTGAFMAALALLACVTAPLLTYSVTLACFGLAHVLSELRYIGARFGPRLAGGLLRGLAGLLAAVILVRVLAINGTLSGSHSRIMEGLLIAALVALVVPTMRAWGPWRLALGLGGTISLGFGALFWPIHTLLLLAVAHNLTPLGFLAEVTPPARRVRVVCVASCLFIGVPLIIATGLPYELLAGCVRPDLTVLPTGPLADHYGTYLPASLAATDGAMHLFAAVVFAQCMHYGVVIHVLPRMLPTEAERAALWPRRGPFLVMALIAGAALRSLFAIDFHEGRAVYGVAAAVHAWVELPILLLALAPGALKP